jgi:thiol-disulfide isomerase/thioredoxin
VAVAAILACHQAAAKTVLLDFSSPGCGPCREMRPVIQRLISLGYPIREVDISREPQFASQFHVDRVPTFIVLVDDKEYGRAIGGGKTEAELADLVHTAEQAAGSGTSAQPSAGPLTFVQDATIATSSAGGSAQPQPGRVVPIDPHPTGGRGSAGPTASPIVPEIAHLIAATVRITVQDAEGQSTGTGTIVDAREGKALILTCGHLFRASAGKGAIEVSLFTAGAHGAELRTKRPGTLINYDLDRDLALLCFETDGAVDVTPIAPTGAPISPGFAVTSVGCEHGANPTPWSSRITAVDRYQGHPNIEAAGAPVEGRSGGGLFNEAGQLVGVCYAADPQGNEGLYAALPSIYAKLDSLNLGVVYEAPSLSTAASRPTGQIAAATSPIQVRGQSPSPAPVEGQAGSPNMLGAFASSNPPTPSAEPTAVGSTPVTSQEQAALEEINRRSADSEVICIIRPRAPGGRSEVIKLDRASPAFVRAISSGRSDSSNASIAAHTDTAAGSVVR